MGTKVDSGDRARSPYPPAAGNGLLDRRVFLRTGLGLGAGLALAQPGAAETSRPDWARYPGGAMSGYGAPSTFESQVRRDGIGHQPGAPGSGASRTPLERLEGVITPSGLVFERHHSGVPAIDPAVHRLTIHGRVKRPLSFSMDALARYPRVTRTWFLECSGNSGALGAEGAAPDRRCSELHGLVSACEYTGIPLSVLLDEAGVEPGARWVVAEGDDPARMNRSVPLAKCLDDALIALYQNGERLRPEHGYPVRLLLPGYEGNMSVKWLRRLQVTDTPAMSREETSKYTDLLPDDTALQFTFPMGVKSVITSPSPGLDLAGAGLYQISGIAWSGHGSVHRVEVSADGGRSWAEAELEDPVRPLCLTRFRAAWRWNGAPAALASRAVDSAGNQQPTRSAWLGRYGHRAFYHYNAIQAWSIDPQGRARNVYL